MLNREQLLAGIRESVSGTRFEGLVDDLARALLEYEPHLQCAHDKIGYRCNWCGAVIEHKSQFEQAIQHDFMCIYIAALEKAQGA